jgi:hypothetical protein
MSNTSTAGGPTAVLTGSVQVPPVAAVFDAPPVPVNPPVESVPPMLAVLPTSADDAFELLPPAADEVLGLA